MGVPAQIPPINEPVKGTNPEMSRRIRVEQVDPGLTESCEFYQDTTLNSFRKDINIVENAAPHIPTRPSPSFNGEPANYRIDV